jgi:Tfp pilus assembly protein PilO
MIMNFFIRKLAQIGLYRWEFCAVVCCGTLICFCIYCVFPPIKYTLKENSGLLREINFYKNRTMLPARLERITKEYNAIDSIIRLSEKQAPFNESDVLKKIYAAGDSSGLAIAKVQIGEPVALSQGKEIPVILNGSGSYTAMGKCISCLENAGYRIRIRQLTLKKEREDKGTLSCDFIIMENN